jgi:hypothetical protein
VPTKLIFSAIFGYGAFFCARPASGEAFFVRFWGAAGCFAEPARGVREKKFCFFGVVNQCIEVFLEFFLKKYFAGMENGCIFASVFDRKTTVHRNG